jgi:hypothetical protein
MLCAAVASVGFFFAVHDVGTNFDHLVDLVLHNKVTDVAHTIASPTGAVTAGSYCVRFVTTSVVQKDRQG